MKRFGLYILLLILPLAVSGCGWTLGGAPALATPANGSTVACSASGYTFRWGGVPNATAYVLEVYNNTTGALVASTTTASDTTTANVASALLTCGGVTYRWRVGAVFSGSSPAFSGYWTFTVQ